ncbi:Nramp family divalent metal transporter [Flaviaesturariibacter aridisoli]|uniref:Divalent metal cation transporter MntH n=1 Tax=Flaviaesturariibacter aridisoli TaxID=2545761 RepID=A0A4R4E536_9BACT|nr:Nramp family divalent metal transporter [Flaviaesturariibacter aridisoli]TCZ74107.1 iron/manganese transporter [Flaviaesturariibacter aridisoli]
MTSSSTDSSLSEVHGSVDTTAGAGKPLWRRALVYFGPAYLVSVGYMDPGNWASDLAGGSRFGYQLVWVLLMSNLMALLLQSLAARLGIVRGRDLAQANREAFPRSLNLVLYILAEIAIAATDLAEVLGMAIGIQLLTGIPLLWAVLITLCDTFLLLLLQRLGMRKMEAFIIGLIAVIGISFLVQLVMAKPDLGQVARGLVPTIPSSAALFIITSIIGATVMPHNLYLHSALVQTRKIRRDDAGIRRALKLNFIDSTIALNAAFFVNAAILVLAASAFYYKGIPVEGIKEAHRLLDGMLGSKLAPILFAVALIAAGQSSTITGTLAGQIVMEGYLKLRIDPWVRRLLTRLLAIVPAVIVILVSGEHGTEQLLLFSQVLLSLQLGFAIIPLIHFVSDKTTMGIFAIPRWVQVLAWIITIILVYLNGRMVAEQLLEYFRGGSNLLLILLASAAALFFAGLLVYITIYPMLRRRKAMPAPALVVHPQAVEAIGLPIVPAYSAIALALDFSRFDQTLLAHALGHARADTRFVLIHVVESASARIHGQESDDLETRKDLEQLEAYATQLRTLGFEAGTLLGYHSRAKEIVRLVKESGADLLIIGAHGHKGMLDWIYGQTIDSVRHALKIPVLIVSA